MRPILKYALIGIKYVICFQYEVTAINADIEFSGTSKYDLKIGKTIRRVIVYMNIPN